MVILRSRADPSFPTVPITYPSVPTMIRAVPASSVGAKGFVHGMGIFSVRKQLE